jgi:hypothetical protein
MGMKIEFRRSDIQPGRQILRTLREVLKKLSMDSKRRWIAGDPRGAAASGSIAIGHETLLYGCSRMLLAFGRSYLQPAE